MRVVLVRPESAANIGACARVVRNTGAAGLDLVSPGDWRTVECWRSAWRAQEVLERARVYQDLAEALAGAGLVVAFTARRPSGPPSLDVREAASQVAALRRDETAALVFGPETSGLANRELALCGRTAVIPAHSARPSYNLSHAVAVAAYEVHRALRRASPEAPRLASHEQKEALLRSLRAGLRALRALPPADTDAHFEDWRRLVQRSDLTTRELRLLEHAARKMAAAGRNG